MVADGQIVEWSAMEGLYLYQEIHTLDYRARHLAAHVGVITRRAEELFGLRPRLSAARLEEQIESLMMRSHLSRRVSTRVILKCYASGSYTLECDEPSIYIGYTMRSLRPEAITLQMQLPMADYPTSASIATRQLADAVARRRGYHTALLTHGEELESEPTRPLAIVVGTTIIMAECESVEANLLERAARKAGFPIEKRRLLRSDLKSADEVLQLSWQGITAMAHVDGRAYMAIIGERIAQELENI